MWQKQRKNRLVTRTTPFLIAHTVVTVQNVVTFRWLKNILSSFCGSSFFSSGKRLTVGSCTSSSSSLCCFSFTRQLTSYDRHGVCEEKRCVNITFDGVNAKRLCFFCSSSVLRRWNLLPQSFQASHQIVHIHRIFSSIRLQFSVSDFRGSVHWHWCARFYSLPLCQKERVHFKTESASFATF